VGAIHPDHPSLTGLIGATHRFDRCRGLVGFASGERLGEFSVVPCCCCFVFGLFWSSEGQVWVLGISSLDRSDQRETPA
jgi:hypothetical protein